MVSGTHMGSSAGVAVGGAVRFCTMTVPQDQKSQGHPAPPSPVWQLHKAACGRAREAVCELWPHAGGWELRLVVDGSILQRSHVCCSDGDARATQEEWKATMVGNGWQ